MSLEIKLFPPRIAIESVRKFHEISNNLVSKFLIKEMIVVYFLDFMKLLLLNNTNHSIFVALFTLHLSLPHNRLNVPDQKFPILP